MLAGAHDDASVSATVDFLRGAGIRVRSAKVDEALRAQLQALILPLIRRLRLRIIRILILVQAQLGD